MSTTTITTTNNSNDNNNTNNYSCRIHGVYKPSISTLSFMLLHHRLSCWCSTSLAILQSCESFEHPVLWNVLVGCWLVGRLVVLVLNKKKTTLATCIQVTILRWRKIGQSGSTAAKWASVPRVQRLHTKQRSSSVSVAALRSGSPASICFAVTHDKSQVLFFFFLL